MRRARLHALLVVTAASYACTGDAPELTIVAMTPASAPLGSTVEVSIIGRGFSPLVHVDYRDPASSVSDLTFTASLGGTELLGVRFVDAQTLTATVPGTLPVGPHTLRVARPAGGDAELVNAFKVEPSVAWPIDIPRISPVVRTTTVTTPPSAVFVSIEDQPDGNGAPITATALDQGDELTVHAVLRDADTGMFLENRSVGWGVTGAIGIVSPPRGTRTTFLAQRRGSGVILTLGSPTGIPPTRTGTISVNPIGLVPPRPWFIPSPTAGLAQVTTFTFDASGTRDDRTDPNDLIFQWDFVDDNVFGAQATGPVVTHVFDQPGIHRVTLRVTDTDQLRAEYQGPVATVLNSSNIIYVNTEVDAEEDIDPGVTTLREALDQARIGSGGRVITFDPSVRNIDIEPSLGDLVVDAPNLALFGIPGLTIKGPGATFTTRFDCLELRSDNVFAAWLDVSDCSGNGIRLNGKNQHLMHSLVHGHGDDGIDFAATSSAVLVGPYNEIHDNGNDGISVTGVRHKIYRNEIWGNASGILVGAIENTSHVEVALNVLAQNERGVEVDLPTGGRTENISINHNTVFNPSTATTVRAVVIASGASNVSVVNNILWAGTYTAVRAEDVSIKDLGYNNYDPTVIAACSPCSETLGGSIFDDAKFFDVSAFDFRLRPDSPCIDAARLSGVDLNDQLPGRYFDLGPDMGAFESPRL